MLRMKALLLLAATTTAVLLAGCNGVGEAETNNVAGTTPTVDTTLPSTPTGLTAAAAGSTGPTCRGVLQPTTSGDRLYLAPQWRPDRDARHDNFRGCGFVRRNDLQL